MSMKVVHLSCVAPPEIGGIGRVAAKEVSLLRARGVHADLIAPEPSETHVAGAHFIKRVEPMFRFGNASALLNLKEDLKKADVIHLHYPFFGTAEPLLFQSKHLPPIVVTYHMDALAPGLKGALFSLHRMILQPLLLNRAAAVVFSSFDYAKRSGAKTYFSKHASQAKEIPFGVNTDMFSPGEKNRERFMLPHGATTFLFVGGLDRAHAFKGVEYLLEAFAHLPLETQLLIVGDGDLRAAFVSKANALGIRSRTHFLGKLDQKSLIEAYHASDVFVFPSTSRAEAFGLAALEAEACGKPVIATDLPGVRKVVLQGQTGLLVQPKSAEALQQAMLRLHEDLALREKLGAGARTHAETFSWDAHIDVLIELYEHCRTH